MSESPKTLEQILAGLSAKLNPKHIKSRDGIRYIDARYVIYRFNAVCPANWAWQFEIVHNPTTDGKVYVDGTLSITVDGVTVSRSGAGEAKGQKLNPSFNPNMPENKFHQDNPKSNKENKRYTAGAFGGGFKAAESDALKRAASKFGFAIELYPGDNPELDQIPEQNHPDKQHSAPTPRPKNAQTTPNDADEVYALIDHALQVARGNKMLSSPTEWVELNEQDRKRLHATIGKTFANNEERYSFAALIGFPASTNDMDRAQRSTFAQIASRRDAKKIVKLIIEAGPLFSE